MGRLLAASTGTSQVGREKGAECIKDQLARIQVSENASIAVVMVRPAISRGTGLPRSVVPFTVMVAFSQPTNRLGMWCFPVADFSGGNAKQNGSPSPLQVSCTSSSSALTVSV